MSFKLCLKTKFLLLFIFLVPVNYNYSSLAQAKPNQFSKTTPEAQQNNSSKFKLPVRGAPMGRRRGGTSRNNCPPLNSPITALVPGEETLTELVQSKSYLALTVSKKPTFWFYIPKLPTQMQTGEFFIETEAGEVLKRTQIKLPSTEGAIAITLPSSSKYSLAMGEKYHWYFKIYCGESTPESGYYFVDAWIERIPVLPELKTRLQITNQTDYLIYRDCHIWYDAINSLGQKLQINPNDNKLKTDWVDLLKSVNLSYLGNLPIIGIYQLK
jgi:hypothetical protein